MVRDLIGRFRFLHKWKIVFVSFAVVWRVRARTGHYVRVATDMHYTFIARTKHKSRLRYYSLKKSGVLFFYIS